MLPSLDSSSFSAPPVVKKPSDTKDHGRICHYQNLAGHGNAQQCISTIPHTRHDATCAATVGVHASKGRHWHLRTSALFTPRRLTHRTLQLLARHARKFFQRPQAAS